MKRTRSLRRAVAALVAAGLVAVPLSVTGAADAKPTRPPGKPVTVMSRNLYLGADINRPVVAAATAQAQGKTPEEVLVALANATYVTRANVDADRLRRPCRPAGPRDRRQRARPHRPAGGGVVAARPARPRPRRRRGRDDHRLRLPPTLLDELAARGAAYVPVSIAPRADVEAPSFTGNPFAGTMGADARDVRLTMRDVVLMHVEDGLRVTDEGQAVYAHNLQVPILAKMISFDRGYQWVDVRAGATRFRFVNTHLEAFSCDIALAQATQLLAEAPAEDRSTVFVCDCNSDPLNTSVKPQDHVPHKAAYDLITGAGDFTDEWLEWAPAEQGWTSGLSELVNDATAAGFDHRIDMVFGRTADGDALGVDRGRVTGTTVDTRDPATGLWPSDHGGVVLRLRGL